MATSGLRGSYAALSYVWGQPQPHSTTINSLPAYMDFIDPRQLPQTILDAIQSTHSLGLRFLWADTLCIIQDSEEDKLREISCMRSVYRNALITIIAASASRVSAGFLETRPTAPITEHQTFLRDITFPFVCPRQGRETTVGEVYVSPIWMNSDPAEQPLVQYDFDMEPINARGWCLQEYFMSPRSLVFATHTVQFHCQGAVQNIGGAFHDNPPRWRRLPDILFLPDADPRLIVEKNSQDWEDLRNAWHMVIADYTRRSISVPGDKLVALGGIAEEFHRAFRTDYLAGLWRDTLLADLLWSKRTASNIHRPDAYRAPSWSWAAVDGQVEAGANDVRAGRGWDVIEVVTCSVSMKDPKTPYGEVTAATLVLHAPLVPCVWNIEKPNLLYRLESSPDISLLASADDEDEVDVAMEPIGIGYLDSDDDIGIKGVWAVPIHWSVNIAGGLIVASDKGLGPDGREEKYRRIGFFQTHGDSGAVRWLEGVSLVDITIV